MWVLFLLPNAILSISNKTIYKRGDENMSDITEKDDAELITDNNVLWAFLMIIATVVFIALALYFVY